MTLYEFAHSVRLLVTWIGSTLLATAVFWLCMGTCVFGCVDTPLPDVDPQARVVVSWDPLMCGDPHRVAVELEDDNGAPLSRSVPCEAGAITLDIVHWGVYRGRIYAWTLGPEIRSVTDVRMDIDAPVIFWTVDTPR